MLQHQVDVNRVAPADVPVVDVDLFENSAATISALHAKGKKIICYFSAGSYEPNRPDSSAFPAADVGKSMDGWPDEKWLRTYSAKIIDIMIQRVRLAAQKGCDAVDPDNVDGYAHDTGFSLTQGHSINLMRSLANEAHNRGMAIGLKNALDILSTLQGDVEFAVNEQCRERNECDRYASFIGSNKPVFHVEYPDGAGSPLSQNTINAGCSDTTIGSIGTIMKKLALDEWTQYCNGQIFGA